MKSILKRVFPNLYAEYLHFKRLFIAIKSGIMKRLPLWVHKALVQRKYRKEIGVPINWDSPKRYTEKIQVEKFKLLDNSKSYLSDKYKVRDYVSSVVNDEILVPLLGVYTSFDDIDFSNLPDQFVIKTNHGTGTNIIVKDKNTFDYKKAKAMIDDWLKTDYGFTNYYEVHYSSIKPLIIIEKYLDSGNGELVDYKFLCFNGKPYYCWVDIGRYTNHFRNVYDLNWTLQPWTQEHPIYSERIDEPENYKEMIDIATKLCQGYSHVRIDLYSVGGKVYFGEMTFTNGSGFERIIPDEFDEALGSLWDCS